MAKKTCPRCDKPLPESALKAGHRFRCPSCGARLRVKARRAAATSSGSSVNDGDEASLEQEASADAATGSSAQETIDQNEAGRRTVRAVPQAVRRLPKVGPYRLMAELGRGGMGVVYKAYHEPTGEIRALKVLRGEAARSKKVIARFEREAAAASSIRHPHIVRVYEFARDPARKCYYMAMEYLEGGSVSALIRNQGRIPWPRVVRIAQQVASALDELQRRGLVHRDVKPSNLLLDKYGNVKLADMGLVRHEDNDDEHQLTTTGAVMGTLDYMAPEQIVDPRNTDIRSDLYALGCTLFHMLTGQPPFPEGNAYQKIQQHLSHPLPEIGPLVPDVASPLALILNRLTAKDPAERFQTPAQLIAALKTLEEEMKRGPSSGSIAVPEELRNVVAQAAEETLTTQRSRRWRDYVMPCLITAVIALALLAVLAVISGGGGDVDDRPQHQTSSTATTPTHTNQPRLPDAPFGR